MTAFLGISVNDDFPEVEYDCAGQAEFEVLGLLNGTELDQPFGLGAFCPPYRTSLLTIDGEGKALEWSYSAGSRFTFTSDTAQPPA